MTRRYAAWAATLLTATLAAGMAQAATSFSGFWEQDKAAKRPAPVLTPWAKKEMRRVGAVDGLDEKSRLWCLQQGMPYLMEHGGPIDIVQNGGELSIQAEHLSLPRHIYLDGRRHPDPAVFDNVEAGNSIGRWKGDTLLVDTVGFSDGVGPAGAPRTASGHLVEQIRISGGKLLVTSTWSDPKVFVKPYTYTLTYKALPADYTAVEDYCSPLENGVGRP